MTKPQKELLILTVLLVLCTIREETTMRGRCSKCGLIRAVSLVVREKESFHCCEHCWDDDYSEPGNQALGVADRNSAKWENEMSPWQENALHSWEGS
jgi:hypothetical protein